MSGRMKVLLDVDTGVDDALALLYALQKPEMEIVGISTVCGNVEASLAAENTLKILDLLDAPDIPVVKGREKPMEREWDGRVAVIHGDNGLGNVDLPRSSRSLRREDVCDFHMRLAEEYPGELVLITLGPLTNVAHTLLKYPGFAPMVKRVVMMGGTVQMRGNVSPVAEANFASDPKACDLVFTSGMDITTVGLDVTMRTRLKREHLEFLTRCCSNRARKAVEFISAAMVHYRLGNQIQNFCVDDCPLHDPLAVMAAVVPGLVRTEARRARIECGGTYCRGMVVTDQRERPFESEYVNFAMEVDADRAIRELLSVFWQESRQLPVPSALDPEPLPVRQL